MARPLLILLVEDNPADARLFELLFAKREGAAVETAVAQTLAEALGRLSATDQRPFDLVLLDLTLPDSEGLDTLRAVQRAAPDLPIVVLSGHSDEDLALSAVREGAQDYLVKGRIDPDILARAARYAIERRRAQGERDRAQHALAVSEERLRLVTEVSTDGVWDWNIAGGEVYWSDRALELLGATHEDIHQFDQVLARIHPDDRAPFEQAVQAAMAPSGPPLKVEVRLLRPDAAIGHVRVSANVVRDANAVPFRVVGSLTDITERKRAEQALRDADEQLRQSQKMEAVGQLASGVAHDFNNLLTAIRGYTSLARHTLQEGHPALESLDQVEEAGRQATGVAGALLTFARHSSPEKTPIHVAQEIESAARLFRRTLPPSVRLVVDTTAADDLWVMGDGTQLQQVVINLALNARDAITACSRPEGSITITARPARVSKPRHQTARPKPAAINIIVRDNGVGMAPDIRARIFEPFFTTKPRGRGTGLGLAVIHGIVQDHEGSISVESTPGTGSTFTVTLPLAEPPAQQVQTPLRQPGDVAGGFALLVENNQLVRGLLASMLSALGFDTAQAPAADRALSLAESIERTIDLVVLSGDLVGGDQLLSDLRARGRLVRAVIVGADADEPASPGTVRLRKPFQLADLRRAIADLETPANKEAPA